MFRRGDLPEPPPADLAAMGLAPGYHVQTMDPQALDRFCRAWGVAANDEYTKRYILACVVPRLHSVVLPPSDAPGMDATKYAALQAHEYGHSWGVPHFANGKGWDWAGSPNALRTAATANALKGTR